MTTRTTFEEIDAPVDLVALARELWTTDQVITNAVDDLDEAKQRIKIAKDTRNAILKRISAAGQFAGCEIKPLRKAS